LKKKKHDLEKLLERIVKQHQSFDKDEEAQKVLNQFRKTLGDEEERRKKHTRRVDKKAKKIDDFLATAEPKLGASKTEIQNNITDPESAKIKGPHGYIQGYNGIAIADSAHQVIVSAEAFGITGESVCLPEMLDHLETNMKLVTGKEEPLEKALFMGDTGYFSEDNCFLKKTCRKQRSETWK
jgi:seryl-tRNA synthetase